MATHEVSPYLNIAGDDTCSLLTKAQSTAIGIGKFSEGKARERKELVPISLILISMKF